MEQLIDKLESIVGKKAVLSAPDELLVYECDGLPQHKHLPRAVVFPASTKEVSEIMRTLARERVPFTPRGAGTGLSGGALALQQGVVIELARMRKILKIDPDNRIAVVQPGVVNLHVSQAAARFGLHYVPDPSSQPTCTIGGNIAESAGGIHCLKYGTTADHVLGAVVVLASGEVVELTSGEVESGGYDLLGVFVGSEGTFGIATEATLRLTRIPPAVRTLLAEFSEVNDASHAVSAIIAAGVMPAALEMMDQEIIRAVEASVFTAGLPLDIGAALLIELDGLEAGIDEEAEHVNSICLRHGARSSRLARDEIERKKLWAARKGAFGAIGRIAPDSMIQDAVVPRSRLPEILDQAYGIASKYRLRLANVFHAGDGNLHPLICFDSRSPDEVRRVKEAGRELMEICVRAGGSITGEHGVGLDKRDLLPLIFSPDDMEVMLRVRSAFDPLGNCNPGKIVPVLRGCGEARAVVRAEQGGRQGDGATGRRADDETGRQQDGETGRSADDETGRQGDGATGRSADDKTGRQGNGAAGRWADDETGTLGVWATGREGDIPPSPLPIPSSPLPVPPSPLPVPSSPRLPVPPSPSSDHLRVSPSSVDQICEVVKEAATNNAAVLPVGGETWANVGNPLDRVNVILETKSLNKIVEHQPKDLIATAQAGVTLNTLNQVLSQNGQWLPLDPPDDGRATIGGIVATGLAGALKLGYGPPRRYVIGMKVVLADGKMIKAGGRVVKNVAGYDLCKLFTGSYGTLAVITEVTFKLRPVPAETRTVVALGGLGSLVQTAGAIINTNSFPVALELVSPSMMSAMDLENRSNQHGFLLRFAGSPESVRYEIQATLKLSKGKGVQARIVAEEEDASVWRKLAALPLRFHDLLTWRLKVLPSTLPKFLNRLSSFPGNSLWLANIAEGQLRSICEPADEGAQIRAFEGLRRDVQESGGSLIIETASDVVKQSLDAWGSVGASMILASRIKRTLDPQGLLSPGRFRFDDIN